MLSQQPEPQPNWFSSQGRTRAFRAAPRGRGAIVRAPSVREWVHQACLALLLMGDYPFPRRRQLENQEPRCQTKLRPEKSKEVHASFRPRPFFSPRLSFTKSGICNLLVPNPFAVTASGTA